MRECPECGSANEDAARFCTSCGAAASREGDDPWLGCVVNGKYRIDELVGKGGMGRVYRARHLTLDRPVVLKILHKAYSGDPNVVRRFQREARAASRLDHPNSIAVLDFGEAEDGTLFMAMEHLGGRDLARLLEDEFPLGEERVVRIGAQILSALAEAHAQGIVHRDLKPENVMVEPRRGERDFVKVLDFGIAKINQPGSVEPKLTQAGTVFGTPEYVSPEQARGEDLDLRTDIYSTGVILYQLATGELPFSSDSPVGYLAKHVAEIPVPPRKRRPDLSISPGLDAAIARALEKDPAKRFQSADEMREALLAAASSEAPAPAAAPPAGAPAADSSAADSPKRPRRGLRAFAVLVALAAAVGGALAVATREDSAVRRRIVEIVSRLAPTRAPSTTAAPTQASTPTSPGAPAENQVQTPAQPQRTAGGARRASPPARRDRARAVALVRRADARRGKQDVDRAIELYLAAEDADSSLAEIQKKLALSYQLSGDTRRARERYRRYLATDPPDADRIRAILSTLR